MLGPIDGRATADRGRAHRNGRAAAAVYTIEANVRQKRNIRGALGRALEWGAVMVGLLWLYANARRCLTP
jgi:hypothetical protein